MNVVFSLFALHHRPPKLSSGGCGLSVIVAVGPNKSAVFFPFDSCASSLVGPGTSLAQGQPPALSQ
jgi:hypothetical protein